MQAALLRAKRVNWTAVVIGFLAVGILINFILLIPALGKLSMQANDGRLARDRQCRTFPISAKIYKGAQQHGFITRRDLDTYLAGRPKGCANRD